MPVSFQLPNAEQLTLEGQVFIIGRDLNCDINLTDYPGVQPQHVRIRRIATRWLVESLGEWSVQVGASEPGTSCWLQPEDVIRLTPNGPELIFQPDDARGNRMAAFLGNPVEDEPPPLPNPSEIEEPPSLPRNDDDEPPPLP